jgi:hypothetical protein
MKTMTAMTPEGRYRCRLSFRAQRRENAEETEADGRVVERSRGNNLPETASGNSLKRWWVDLPAVPMTRDVGDDDDPRSYLK